MSTEQGYPDTERSEAGCLSSVICLPSSGSQWPWRTWAGLTPDSIALWHEQEPLTWAALARRLDAVAVSLARQGVGEGKAVALCGKNSFTLLLAYLASMQLGARVLPLNPQLPKATLDAIFTTCAIDCVWSAEASTFAVPTLNLNPEQQTTAGMAADWKPQRPATLTLTSGSGGLPKAVVHNIAAHCANAQGVVALMGYAPPDCWLLSLPLFHVSGQGIVWRWLISGATLALRTGKSLAENLQGCSHASLVPTQLLRLLENNALPPALRKVLLGGAAIPVELVERAEAAGVACWCGYGLTEMGSTVCAKRANAHPGVGKPLSGRRIKVVDEEILLAGAGLAMGYWQDGSVQPLTDEAGWFHTRDRGAFVDGEWRVLGRLDNLFISGGENIQPEAVERVIATYPGVVQVFVVPVPDREFGHRPLAVIEGEVSFEQLRDWLRDKLAPYQQPIACYPLPASLKTGAIKVSRQAVGEWVAGIRDQGSGIRDQVSGVRDQNTDGL